MSSLALYRRYRPESFAEVIGQEHVTDPLQQALRNNRVNHAYLFSGPRGCGKTTSARILARCLNCEQGPTPTPCGECQSCRDLARNGPGSIDVIEIDAASHGGVDDARELREKAFFGPASSRYKIYIIDEAHMVTSAGFNALLKVVEEPPEHLKFIFATTEPEKVIGTIRSRTHHYPFRLVPPGTLRDYLADVCGREKIPVEDGVLPLVVRAGAGSVRDSMSVMDQLLAGAREEGVTYAMATSLLGYTDGSLLDSVVEAFATGDGAAAFEVVDRIIEGGNDPRRFVADLLERLRDLVILAAVPDAVDKGLIDAPADVLERMQAQAGTFGAAELSRAADLVNEGLTEMRGATSPRLQLELICARVLLPAAYGDERSVMARLDRLERGVNFSGGGTAPAMGYVPGPDAHASAPAPAAPAAPAVPPGGGPAAARAAVREGALRAHAPLRSLRRPPR
ncbi:DNA polymerase III subunit gamma and tau, partial [Streptomyces sp. DI166]|uniref:DNA polymerase III subunit gamma and tau n=1 Tax=Streptomyces sp. DI166 TaxID=1839783 RepID=UPI001146EB0C